MNKKISRFLGMLVKIVIVIVVLSLLALVGLYIYLSLTKEQITSGPPPGFENRIRYNVEGIPGMNFHKIVPVDIWFGEHVDQYDTTHFRINSDYVSQHPHYHGEAVKIMVVWPSMLSLQEYKRQRKQTGLPADKKRNQFTIVLHETSSANAGDKAGTEAVFRCEPILRDEERGVKYCNENRFDNEPDKRLTHYWPLDEKLRTPWYNNAPHAWCKVVKRQGKDRFEACSINFSYNTDVNVTMLFVPEELSIDIITDLTRLTNFLSTLEVKP